MKKLSAQSVGVDKGDVVLFSDYEHDGDMWTGDGQREVRVSVAFSDTFRAAPVVFVTMTMWDMSNAANARADVQAVDVTSKDFVIRFRTWGDTQVARVRVGWLAMGPILDDDVWDV